MWGRSLTNIFNLKSDNTAGAICNLQFALHLPFATQVGLNAVRENCDKPYCIYNFKDIPIVIYLTYQYTLRKLKIKLKKYLK